MPTIALSRPRTARRLHPDRAFWAIAAIAVTFPAASSAPSPLYTVYQDQWGFSASTLTVVFAIYALALLGSLLVFGALSDHVGRRPVLAWAIALEAVSFVVFLSAGDVGALLVARVLQGIATGAAIATLSAALIDLTPAHTPGRGGLVNGVAPLLGLAVGALGCGLLVQLAPAPTHLIWEVLLAGLVVAAVAVAAVPETSPLRTGARTSLRPRIGLPSHLRGEFLVIAPTLCASWALGGLYMSLGPSVAAQELGASSKLVGGIVVALLCASGALTATLLRAREPRTVLRLAAAFLTGGMLVTLLGLAVSSLPLAAAGTVLSGVGFGAAGFGAFGTLAIEAAPQERGEVFALAYVVSYLAFSVPAVVAGFGATQWGLHGTSLAYGAAIAALAAAALWRQRPSAAARREPSELPA